MRIRGHIDIDAPPSTVWDVVGPAFTAIGTWASTVPHSEPTADGEGRVCAVDAPPGVDGIVERLTAYDDADRTLTYVADAGMPSFVRAARNTWTVRPLPGDRSRVSLAAEIQLSRVARLEAPLVWLGLRLLGRRTLRDLEHYVRTGRPSTRKRRQLARARGATPTT